jgi:phenylacetate-CoA ligase
MICAVPRGDRGATGPAELWALRVAQEAAACVPAYGRFLRQAGYDATCLRSFEDFCALPVMDKPSYLVHYPLADRCRHSDLTRAYVAVFSSGTGGPATLWPRYPDQEPATVGAVRTLLQEHFRIQHHSTLVVLATAMGPWAFGTGMTLVTQRIFADPDARGAVVTPGLDQDHALHFVEQLGPYYDQTVIVGYPTLLPPLLEAGVQRGIAWRSLDVSTLTAGEAASEAQRERVLEYLGKNPEQLEGFVSLFGASEVAGVIGYETRLCLLLRRLCINAPCLAAALFGTSIMPSVIQYNPRSYFLQVEEGEVLLTMRGAVPLIRYNTHDRGGLLRFEDVVSTCRSQGYDLGAELQARGCGIEHLRPLPLLYVHGRSDAITVHSVNVYLDEVAHALEQPALRTSNTGNFEVSTVSSAAGLVTLRVVVELRAGLSPDDALLAVYQQRVLAGLAEASPRFRATYEASRERTALEVAFVSYGTMQGRGPKRQRVVLPHEVHQASGAPPHDGASGR